MALETKITWNGTREKTQMTNAMLIALTRSINIVQADAKLLVRKDTTNLEAAIVKAVYPNTLNAIVSVKSEYAAAQEFGLDKYSNYGFTPYMRPALNNNKAKIKQIFIQEGSKSVDK